MSYFIAWLTGVVVFATIANTIMYLDHRDNKHTFSSDDSDEKILSYMLPLAWPLAVVVALIVGLMAGVDFVLSFIFTLPVRLILKFKKRRT